MTIFKYSKPTLHAIVFPKSGKRPKFDILTRDFPKPWDISEYSIDPLHSSELEIAFYQILLAVLPNHIVMCNVDLDLIFDYHKVKKNLGPQMAEFILLSSHIDFYLINQYPKEHFGIELDGPHHTNPRNRRQHFRDAKKNTLFDFCGIPLLRIRPAIVFRRDDQEIISRFTEDLSSLFETLGVN